MIELYEYQLKLAFFPYKGDGFSGVMEEDKKPLDDVTMWLYSVIKEYRVSGGVDYLPKVDLVLRLFHKDIGVLRKALEEMGKRIDECPHFSEKTKKEIKRVINSGLEDEDAGEVLQSCRGIIYRMLSADNEDEWSDVSLTLVGYRREDFQSGSGVGV